MQLRYVRDCPYFPASRTLQVFALLQITPPKELIIFYHSQKHDQTSTAAHLSHPTITNLGCPCPLPTLIKIPKPSYIVGCLLSLCLQIWAASATSSLPLVNLLYLSKESMRWFPYNRASHVCSRDYSSPSFAHFHLSRNGPSQNRPASRPRSSDIPSPE